MIVNLIVKSFGGVWRVKERAQRSRLLRKIYYIYLTRRGSYIGADVSFENKPVLPHGLASIFIARGAVIGKNAVIFQQVTIGSNTLPGSKGLGVPIIGDNVYIGAGAKIIGGVKVGSNVRIGANVVVVEDIPEGSVVVGLGCRVLARKNLNNKFYMKNYEERWHFALEGEFYEERDEGVLADLRER